MPRASKRYYSIGEVARLLDLEPHVLRFWEKEFRQIRPLRVSGRRLYRAEHVELFKRIKRLLYEEGYTISGAKKKLSQPPNQKDLWREIREELEAIYRLLEEGNADSSR